jgi:hypothetical protein
MREKLPENGLPSISPSTMIVLQRASSMLMDRMRTVMLLVGPAILLLLIGDLLEKAFVFGGIGGC